MRARTIRYAFVASFIAATVCAGVSPAHGAEKLCDPSFQNCRDGAGNLIELIKAETQGIDVAFWFMEDSRYASQIINRWKNFHVPVRLIVDPRANATYPLNKDNLKAFQDAGIPMIKKSGDGYMHWKAMIFKGQNIVEFGSANFSPNAFVPVAPYTNYVSETIFYSDDPDVVHSFKKKFDLLWTDTRHYSVYANLSTDPSARVPSHDPNYTIHPDLDFPPDSIQPGENYSKRLIALENAETQKIDVQMYRITQKDHSDAMIAAQKRGVPIRYIGETREYRNPDRVWVSWNMDRMYAAGIPMRVRNVAGEYHEKLVLLYGQGMSVFGSSNWTSPSANAQQEHNYFTRKTDIFQWFEAQFNRMWNNANPVNAVETIPFTPLPPGTPSYVSITDHATGVPTTGQKLVWNGGLWAHYFDLYFGTTPPTASTPVFAANLALPQGQSPGQNQSFVLPTLQPGTTYYWKIVSKTAAYPRAGSSVSKAGGVWSFTTAGSSGGGGLPAPWSDADIGNVGIPGSAQFANGTFTINASGADIWGAADAFNFVYRPWSGDGSIVARVAGVTNTADWVKAGVMFRATLDAGSAHAFMLVSATKGVSFQRRPTAGGTSVSTTVAGVAPPEWVRLVRSGNTVTASYSSNGTTWTQVGSDTISMPQSLFVGMAVTSHNNATLTTATFDSVAVSPGGGGSGSELPSPWVEQDVGGVGLAGSAQYANGTFTVSASGADIWGSADAFHYVYQPWTGNGSIVARVGSVVDTDDWAKAGVMFRATLDPGSVHAFMLLSAAKGVSFIRRTATGGTSVSTTVAGVAAPRWVRLNRSGDTLTASHSSDGTNWSLVGTATVSMPQSLFVGLAVTSHNNTVRTTATVNSVTAQ